MIKATVKAHQTNLEMGGKVRELSDDIACILLSVAETISKEMNQDIAETVLEAGIEIYREYYPKLKYVVEESAENHLKGELK